MGSRISCKHAPSHMNKELFNRAKELAARPYQIEVTPDETTDGEPCFYVRVAELPGCSSWGVTADEAKANIEDAKVDFIYFLLADGLFVPAPGSPSCDHKVYLGSHDNWRK